MSTVEQLLFAMVFLALPLQAQERFDPDELFKQARDIGFDGKREESRQLCLRILEQYPNYKDVRIFLGRLQSWDAQYGDARENLLMVLSSAPENVEARRALIDVELWSDNPDRALQYSEAGLESSPAEETFMYRKAVALNKLSRTEDAVVTLENLLLKNPGNSDARSLLDSLQARRRLYTFSADYGYEHLSGLAPWQGSSISLSRETPLGSVIGRLNYANRFSTNTYQVEVDAYPGIRKGLYAYVNYGYSPESIFPRHRAGLELFSNPGQRTGAVCRVPVLALF